jgi:hypothetical protein
MPYFTNNLEQRHPTPDAMLKAVPLLTWARAGWLSAAILAFGACPGLYADSAPPLNVCAVLRSAADYSRKLVRLRGILAVGAEQAVLYDPECAQGIREAELAATAKFKRNRRLDHLLKKNRRAWVVVEGTFYGPELAQIDPKLPQWMKNNLKGTMTRYGHLGSYSSMIEIIKVIRVDAVPADTP